MRDTFRKEVLSEGSICPSGISRSESRVSLIDTHCHLDMLGEDCDAVVQRAKDAGVEAIITISSDFGSNAKNVSIAEAREMVYASVGIHPHDAKDASEQVLKKIRELLEYKKVVAIGETGLDYHYDHSPRDVQKEVFRRHLALAKERGLPVVVHSREAKEETLEILGIHCFGAQAAEIIHIGQAIMAQPAPANSLRYFINTTFNYPTMAEAYRVAALNGFNRLS